MNQINVNVSTLSDFECTSCKGIYFTEVRRLKVLPAFQSPNGQAGLVPVPVIQCISCNTISDPLNPINKKEIKL